MVETREHKLALAFVDLADTLVSDYDVADLLHGLVTNVVDLLGASAVGLLLSDQRGNLQLLASSAERAHLLELFQLQNNEGPCLDCFGTGQPVVVADLSAEADRWPAFVPAAQQQGFAAVHALPLRLRDEVIGAMNMFMAEPGVLPGDDQRVAQALADVATIGILQERAIHHNEALAEQLQGALNSRIIIEQAKGILAQHGGVGMDEAFQRLRQYSRTTHRLLSGAARDVVEGRLDPQVVLAVAMARTAARPSA